MPLTKSMVEKFVPDSRPKKISDGGGLFLLVQPHGAKLWRMNYRFLGKQKTLYLGAYPEISLDDARGYRDAAKKLLRDGTDPSEEKKRQDRDRRLIAENTFEMVAGEWLEKLRREGRAQSTLEKIEWILTLAAPSIGQRPLSQISSIEVLEVLRAVESRGRFETARRLRGTIGAVFRYGIATARAANDPTVALRGALTVPKVTHRPALTAPPKVGALMRALDNCDGQPTVRAALNLMALMFPRPGELRGAKWEEIDFEKAVWIIPADRTKMRRPHHVPLARQAIEILKSLSSVTGKGEFVFPSVRSVKRPISENTLNAALRRLGYANSEMTAHGFRAMASTLLNESGKWQPDVIERQLAHIERDAVRRAYARAEYWDERVRMMTWWADYLDMLRENLNVVDLGAHQRIG